MPTHSNIELMRSSHSCFSSEAGFVGRDVHAEEGIGMWIKEDFLIHGFTSYFCSSPPFALSR